MSASELSAQVHVSPWVQEYHRVACRSVLGTRYLVDVLIPEYVAAARAASAVLLGWTVARISLSRQPSDQDDFNSTGGRLIFNSTV